jgi:hypothetical protein
MSNNSNTYSGGGDGASFKTTPANRAAVKAVARADLNLVGPAMWAERKMVDKIVDGLKFHS